MLNIQGVTKLLEPAEPRRVTERGRKAESKPEVTQDAVVFSDEAKQASKAARIAELSKKQSEMRAERIAQAKESIEKGTYKVQEVVLQVATRISKYM